MTQIAYIIRYKYHTFVTLLIPRSNGLQIYVAIAFLHLKCLTKFEPRTSRPTPQNRVGGGGVDLQGSNAELRNIHKSKRQASQYCAARLTTYTSRFYLIAINCLIYIELLRITKPHQPTSCRCQICPWRCLSMTRTRIQNGQSQSST
jgi:hypothetical protein